MTSRSISSSLMTLTLLATACVTSPPMPQGHCADLVSEEVLAVCFAGDANAKELVAELTKSLDKHGIRVRGVATLTSAQVASVGARQGLYVEVQGKAGDWSADLSLHEIPTATRKESLVKKDQARVRHGYRRTFTSGLEELCSTSTGSVRSLPAVCQEVVVRLGLRSEVPPEPN